jgi:hypothetical protein
VPKNNCSTLLDELFSFLFHVACLAVNFRVCPARLQTVGIVEFVGTSEAGETVLVEGSPARGHFLGLEHFVAATGTRAGVTRIPYYRTCTQSPNMN